MAILGLASTESYSANRFLNIRRSVQYQYPNGKAPLTGLLSLAGEESTNDPKYSHWEKRLAQQRTLTAANGGGGFTATGAFREADGTDLADDATYGAGTFTWTAETSYLVYVDDADGIFRVGHVVKINATISAVDTDLKGVVTAVNAASDYLTVRAVNTVASVPALNTALDDEVLVVGSAFAQGVTDQSTEIYNLPVEFQNYTQIFRTPFSFTGTSLKTPLKFDESGPYKDKAKEHSVSHMIEIEKSILFGHKNLYYSAATPDPTDGTGLPTYMMGGILYYMERWEAGDYGTVTASSDSDDDKRIITNAAGTLDEDTFDTYLERCFRVTNNTSNEKLCLCGSNALKVVNQMFRSKAVLNTDLSMQDTYGMNVTTHVTPFGTVHYKTHPLFTQNSTMRNWMLFLDVKNLKLRPMVGRDTELLKNRQPNDADYRKDEWFTEMGFEMWFPESHLLLKNVTDYTP